MLGKVALASVALVGLSTAALADGYAPRGRYYPHPFNWTGCYIGAHAGGGWGSKSWADPAFADLVFSRHDVDGGLAGGQVGCDFQTGLFVVGVEGSASWADLKGGSMDSLSGGTLRDHSQVDFISTLTGRVGLAFDRSLVYVKGGAAVANDNYNAKIVTSGATFYSADESRWGWLIGAGFEHAFSRYWSAKIEYNYMDFGQDRLNFRGGLFQGVVPFDIDQQVHVVKLGINYRFGGDEYRPLK